MKVHTNWNQGRAMSIQAEEGITKHWAFAPHEEEECELAYAMGIVAVKNGLSINDLSHLFPAVLRMLKSKSEWDK